MNRRPGELDHIEIWYPDDFLTDDERLNRLANKIIIGLCIAVIALAAAIHQGWV